MTKKIIALLIVACSTSLAQGQEQKYQVSFSAGISHVFRHGSEADYVLGENDFPVTPAHTPATFCLSFAYLFSKRIAVEIAGIHSFRSQVKLVDPSDEDMVIARTANHWAFSANLIYQFLKKRFMVYGVVGGGADFLRAKEETYTSQAGYEVDFGAPEDKVDLLLNFGGGMRYFFASDFGLGLDIRCFLIFNKPDSIRSLSAGIGPFFRF